MNRVLLARLEFHPIRRHYCFQNQCSVERKL
jgi:hypothetical protein